MPERACGCWSKAQRTTAVGSFPPNGFGLYDCAGSVWEWCHDWYEPDWS
ncbi:formylglycine-generating enzyme family protein [Candidatus Poribacteria bacterium]|nr:formylglycine-generating enzyme family protein [Candidatus Poribacteria bacterium]